MLKYLIIFVFIFTACSQSNMSKKSIDGLTGDITQRVAKISALIKKHKALPTTILDAYFVEEKIGGGILGPSDFRTFYVIEVAPQDLAQWTKNFIPVSIDPQYVAPAEHCDWWISSQNFSSLKFYQPDSLIGNSDGWMGVSSQKNRIYIFTFTK